MLSNLKTNYMKKQLLKALIAVLLFLMPYLNFGQAPDLGDANGFVLFTAAGAFDVLGASTVVTGDVGTNVGAFTGFPPGTLIGQIHAWQILLHFKLLQMCLRHINIWTN